jgi:hypothetical protein
LLDRRPLCPLCSRLSKVVSHELRSTRPLREGTLREHSCGHARPLAVSRRRSFSGVCGWFVSVDSLACPRFPPLCSMVRRGSTVRVRQKALQRHRKTGSFVFEPTCTPRAPMPRSPRPQEAREH